MVLPRASCWTRATIGTWISIDAMATGKSVRSASVRRANMYSSTPIPNPWLASPDRTADFFRGEQRPRVCMAHPDAAWRRMEPAALPAGADRAGRAVAGTHLAGQRGTQGQRGGLHR